MDPKEKETDPRVVERLAPVVSEPLDASAAPRQELPRVSG